MLSHTNPKPDTSAYMEMVCIPTDCYEVFVDFIAQVTGEALEEVATSTLKTLDTLQVCNIPQERGQSVFIDSRAKPSRAIVIRTLDNPSLTPLRDYAQNAWIDDDSSLGDKTLVQALESFAYAVSQRVGYMVGFGYMIARKCNQDWIALYQASVAPLECGRYYIRPSWHLAKMDKEDIVIDPALAFGSGHHASTFMCIALLSAMDLADKHCLDVGCGSGILGIIMAKQGGVVEACDVDMLAVEETKKNFEKNALCARKITQGSLADILLDSSAQHSYDVICANIVADVLACMHRDFITALKPSGVLILSGILEEKCEWIEEIFSDMQLVQKEHRDEWVSLKFALVT